MKPRRWVSGTLLVAVLAIAALGVQGLVLRKAMSLEADRAAWEAGLEQRTAEQKRLVIQTEASRSALDKIQAKIIMADQELGSRESNIAALKSVWQKTAEARENLAAISEEFAKKRQDKDATEKATSDMEVRKASLGGEANQLASQRDQLVAEIASKRTQLGGLEKKVAELAVASSEKARLDAAVSDLQKEVRSLRAQHDDLTKAVESLEKQRAEVQRLSAAVVAASSEKAALDIALTDLKKQKDTWSRLADDANRAAMVAKRDQQDAEKAAADAASAQSAAEKKRRATEQEAGEAAAQKAKADKERLDAEALLQQVREKLSEAGATLQAKQALVTQKEKELKDLQALEERLRKQPTTDASTGRVVTPSSDTVTGGDK
jgi:chromosome segregation ATPase